LVDRLTEFINVDLQDAKVFAFFFPLSSWCFFCKSSLVQFFYAHNMFSEISYTFSHVSIHFCLYQESRRRFDKSVHSYDQVLRNYKFYTQTDLFMNGTFESSNLLASLTSTL